MAGLNLSHGEARKNNKTFLYKLWVAIHERCATQYKHKGIKVAREWEEFPPFKKYVENYLGPRPTKNHSIDRINNKRPYAPGNIRWATPFQQANNRGNTPKISFKGVRKSPSEWALETGVAGTTIMMRIWRGWSIERALFEKPWANKLCLTFGGKTKSAYEWAQIKNIPLGVITKRKKLGWSDHDALSTPVRAMRKKGSHAG